MSCLRLVLLDVRYNFMPKQTPFGIRLVIELNGVKSFSRNFWIFLFVIFSDLLPAPFFGSRFSGSEPVAAVML